MGAKNPLWFLQSLFIIDTNFNIVASSENITASTSDYFAHADSDSLNGNFIISDAYQRLIDGEMTTVVAAYSGIFDLNTQNIIGYVVEEIPTSYFDNYRSNTTLWENGLLYLIDNNNFLSLPAIRMNLLPIHWLMPMTTPYGRKLLNIYPAPIILTLPDNFILTFPEMNTRYIMHRFITQTGWFLLLLI